MDSKLLISASDVAIIIDGLSLGARDEKSFKDRVWAGEKDFLKLGGNKDMKKWLYDVQHWTDYIYGSNTLDREYAAAKTDMGGSGDELPEDDFIMDGFDLSIVFKSMRLRLLYAGGNGAERTTLREVLLAYGYRKGTPYILAYIRRCLDFYRIGLFDEHGNEIDISGASPDAPVVFKVKGAGSAAIAAASGNDAEPCAVSGAPEEAWTESNSRSFAVMFRGNAKNIMEQAKYLGEKSWGDGGGSGPLPTYEVATADGRAVWCAAVEYAHARTQEPNRCGIIAAFPSPGEKSMGQPLAAVLPYEYGKRFNTLAYRSGDRVEIRNYGRITSGRQGISREEFFAWMDGHYPELVRTDGEGRKYFNVYEYDGTLTEEAFAEQTYRAVKVLSEAKAMKSGQKRSPSRPARRKAVRKECAALSYDAAEKLASRLIKVRQLRFSVSGRSVVCTPGMAGTINNQGGALRDENFFGRNLEFTMNIAGKLYRAAFQMYVNDRGHCRIFLYGQGNKMLTSVNLTSGFDDGRIVFGIQIKVTSPHGLSKLQRARKRDGIIKELRTNGLKADSRNHVALGIYDIHSDEFIGTDAAGLLRNMLIIGICRNRELFPLF